MKFIAVKVKDDRIVLIYRPALGTQAEATLVRDQFAPDSILPWEWTLDPCEGCSEPRHTRPYTFTFDRHLYTAFWCRPCMELAATGIHGHSDIRPGYVTIH